MCFNAVSESRKVIHVTVDNLREHRNKCKNSILAPQKCTVNALVLLSFFIPNIHRQVTQYILWHNWEHNIQYFASISLNMPLKYDSKYSLNTFQEPYNSVLC